MSLHLCNIPGHPACPNCAAQSGSSVPKKEIKEGGIGHVSRQHWERDSSVFWCRAMCRMVLSLTGTVHYWEHGQDHGSVLSSFQVVLDNTAMARVCASLVNGFPGQKCRGPPFARPCSFKRKIGDHWRNYTSLLEDPGVAWGPLLKRDSLPARLQGPTKQLRIGHKAQQA